MPHLLLVRQGGEWNFPALGSGVVDFPAMFAVLDAHGFTGPSSIELEGIQGTKQTTEEVKQAVEASLVHLREVGAMS